MPSPLYIRKQILEALQTEIIPLLQQQTFALLMGGTPLCFKGTKPVVVHKTFIADQQEHPLEMVSRWPQHQLFSKRIERLGILYEGATQEYLGVTKQMAAHGSPAQRRRWAGVTSFCLEAPAIYVIPSNVPHRGVSSSQAGKDNVKLLMFHFNEREIFLNLSANSLVTHHLHLPAPAIIALFRQYIELAHGGNTAGAQLLLLTAMQSVHGYLTEHYLNISNSSWPPLGGRAIAIPVQATEKNALLCHQAIDYIQLHLHAPLTLKVLAAHCEVSERHLNKIFKNVIGITLMRFITQYRIEAAKGILRRTDERIGDIAKLVGFANSHSFDGSFRRSEKISPREYRRLHTGPS